MTQWREQADRGSLFWIRALAWATSHLSRSLIRVICAIIALVFLCTARQPRQASRYYLRKVLQTTPRLWHVFRHFYTFALVSADRLQFLGGKADSFDLTFSGEECVRRYAREGRGCILLVSHFGSFDAMRVPAVEDEHIAVRILIDKQHNPAAMQVIETLNPEMAATAMDAGGDSSAVVLEIAEALAAGQMVGMMADRAREGESLRTVRFLGEDAQLPQSPWIVSLVLKAPVIVCHAAYTGGNRYAVHFTQLSDGSAVPRKEREACLQRAMAMYARELEAMVQAQPYNWFNFYNFWLNDSTYNH